MAAVVTVVAVMALAVITSAQGLFAPPPARTVAGDPARPLTAPSTAGAVAIVGQFLRDRGIDIGASSLVTVGDATAAKNDISVVRLEQIAAGFRVYGTYAKAAFTSRGELVQLIENFVPAAAGADRATRINETQALNVALRHHYPNETIAIGTPRREGGRVVFARTPFFPCRAQRHSCGRPRR